MSHESSPIATLALSLIAALIGALGAARLRALVKYLSGISDAGIQELEILTGIPFVHKLGDDLRPLERYYLGGSPVSEVAQKHLEHVVRAAGQVA